MTDPIKQQILDLIQAKPKHFSAMIKRHPILSKWVADNTLITSDRYPDMLYSAIHQESNVCKHGNVRSVGSLHSGWIGCGPANVCACTKASISANVTATKSKVSDADNALINQKRAATTMARFGVPYNTQRPSVRAILSAPKVSPEVYALLSDRDWLDNEYNIRGRSLSDISDQLGVYYQTVGDYCRSHGFKIRQVTNYSREELKMSEFLTSLGVAHVCNDWDQLDNMELDIYIPDSNLAIEINGLYWHSYAPNNRVPEKKYRHARKTHAARAMGIDLIYFTDQEIREKWHMVTETIKSRLGMDQVISSEDCTVGIPDIHQQQQFFDSNHLGGHVKSAHAFGLYDTLNQLVQLMTVDQSDTKVIMGLWPKLGVTVSDGGALLMQHARPLMAGRTVVAYSDDSRCNGSQYAALGFTVNSVSEPRYSWTDNNSAVSANQGPPRDWLAQYDDARSECNNMFAAGYRRYWDCGQREWRLNPDIEPSTLG